jgi:hypothetical protein
MPPTWQTAPPARPSSSSLPILEQRLRQIHEPQPAPDPHTALGVVLQKSGLNGSPLRRRFPWRELALVAAVLVGMLFLGSSLDVLTPFDARPSPTPVTPTARPRQPTSTPLVLPGAENEDYFIFQYYPAPDDTYEKLAGLTGFSADQLRSLNRAAPGRSLSSGNQMHLAMMLDRYASTPRCRSQSSPRSARI